MDVKYINPFFNRYLKCTQNDGFHWFNTRETFLKKNAVVIGDVSGIIGLTGEVHWSLSVTFTFNLLKEIMNNMLGETIDEITDDVKDAVGEITNMICGDARRALQQEGLSLSAAIPTIVAGKNHTIKHAVKGPIIIIPFKSDTGQAVVEVSLEA